MDSVVNSRVGGMVGRGVGSRVASGAMPLGLHLYCSSQHPSQGLSFSLPMTVTDDFIFPLTFYISLKPNSYASFCLSAQSKQHYQQ
jgi:hypothetical protein